MVQFIYLKGDYITIERRMQSRESHFMTKSLLQSQFDTLEEPDDAIVVDIRVSPLEILESILDLLPPNAGSDNWSIKYWHWARPLKYGILSLYFMQTLIKIRKIYAYAPSAPFV